LQLKVTLLNGRMIDRMLQCLYSAGVVYAKSCYDRLRINKALGDFSKIDNNNNNNMNQNNKVSKKNNVRSN